MSKKESSRKPLIIGIIAAVVILAVLLVLLLTQCMGGEPEATNEPTATTSAEIPTYELYWNADRAEYDGKSEAGMSSRMPESDGYFHVRFILDGEEVILKVADRKLINAIDVKDLMGLTFDENGIVNGVLELDDMPLEKLGWQFYVQSAAKTLIKLNSSESMNGMEVLLEMGENSAVYDMTGLSGPKGVKTDAISMDRVYAIANLAGEVTHVFIYQRPNYMLTHEAECQHCKKTVTWYEWTKTDTMPVTEGHYQLMNDIQLKKQPAQKEDSKICIDLNGKRVDGASGARVYAMFNANTELAIMDTSEGQTGVMAAHGTGDQGMVVWVRYGQFHLYGGTLDASDATTKLQGTAIECGKGKYFYMHGGTIIGGKAQPQKNSKGQWTAGLGGAIYLGGKFVMNGGEIRGGNAAAVITKYNADGTPNTYSRGMGGNIFMSGSAVMEMNGGVIKNGTAGNQGGNIYMDGASELTINDGLIYGGTINGKGRNGGNISAGSKAVITQNGGSILKGSSRNCAGNVYLNGKYTMNGGVIADGVIRDFKTGKVQANSGSANVFVVNGKFHMYGGKVAGGFQAIDTKATDTADTTVLLSGYATIDGGEKCTRNLTLSTGGSGVTVYVGNMLEGSRVGVYATTGYFTLPTKEANKEHFFSDIEGADILYHDQRLALGRLQCICGSNSDDPAKHLGACRDSGGEKVVFAPWTSGNSMPATAGNYYLLADTLSVPNTSVVTPGDGEGSDVIINLDLNGKQITSKSGRFYSLFENKVSKNEDGTWAGNITDEHIELSISDSVGTAKVTVNARTSSDSGFLIWGRYRDSVITVYGGTFDGTAVSAPKHDGAVISANGKLNIHGGHFVGGNSYRGGIINARDFYMDGGIIENGTAMYAGGNVRVFGNSQMRGGIIRGGSINAEGTMVGDLGYGGNLCVSGTFNMYDGEISGGLVKIGQTLTDENGNVLKDENGKNVKSGGGGLGGNIWGEGGQANLYGGVIRDGVANTGGNIGTNVTTSGFLLDGVQILNGVASGNGGNIAINVRANKSLVIAGDTLISDGTAASSGGNIYVNAWAANGRDARIVVDGGTVENGVAAIGGNFYLTNSTSGDTKGKAIVEMNGGVIIGGVLSNAKNNGGNVYLNANSEFILNGGTVSDGHNAKQGGNFYVAKNSCSLTVNDGKILKGDVSDIGGNITLQSRAVLKVNGGVIADGTSNGKQSAAANIASVNGDVTITGGEIVGGFSNTSTYEGGALIMLDKDARVSVNEGGYGLSRGKWNSDATKAAAMSLPVIQVGELTQNASVALSTAGYNTVTVDAKYLQNFSSALADAEVHHFDGRIFLGKVACICGGTAEIGPCAEGGHERVAWMPWNGTDDFKEDGHYYLDRDVSPTSQRILGYNDNASCVSINLNGHTLTVGFRALQLRNNASLNIADHKGGGAILSKGKTTDNFGGIQMLSKNGTVNFYSGTIGMAEGHVSHKEIALIEASGTFNMYGGTVSGDGKPSGTLIRVAGTFNMYGGTVSGGFREKNFGGNFQVSGTLNLFDGTVSGGKAKYGGNIYATGTVNISGDAVVMDGVGYTGEKTNYPKGGNIYLTGSSAVLNMDGGTVSGGQLTGSNWMAGGNICAENQAKLTFDGGAVVEHGKGSDGNNLYMTTDGTAATLLDCTFTNSHTVTGNIMVERGNLTIDGATITNTGSGYNIRANEGAVKDKDGNVTGYKTANITFLSGLISGGKPNVALGGKDSFTMSGGTVENGKGTNGGNFTLTDSDLTVSGGVIKEGEATGSGGNIAMSQAGTLTINGGEIKDGTSGSSGGNIVLWDASTMVMTDGTVSGGKAGAGSGNIYFSGNTVSTISGGTVSGGVNGGSSNGGNIGVNGTATLTISGGTVKDGYSQNQGGNIASWGKLIISGGTITGGQSKAAASGMNISAIASSSNAYHELQITGGTIAGGVYFNNWKDTANNIQHLNKVTISGNPVIDKSLTTQNVPTYSFKLGINDITVGELTEGARIMVSGTEGIFSYPAPKGAEQYFHSEVEGMAVWQIEDELVLVYGRNSCVCGSNSDNPDDHIGDCDGTKHNWLPVSEIPSTSGYYYLIADVTDSGNQRILTTKENIFLDLNGKTVKSQRGRLYRLEAACNIVITDNSANRDGVIEITGQRDQGAAIWLYKGGASVFAMYAGTIDASGVYHKDSLVSGGLALSGSSGTFKLYGGTIKGGKVHGTNLGGSAIAFEGGKIHILGDMEVTSEGGSAIFVGHGAKLDLSHVTEKPDTPWAVDASGVFTENWNKDWKIEDYFVSASSSGAQIYLDESGELTMGKFYCECGVDSDNAADHLCDCSGEDIFWMPWRDQTKLPTSGNYYLTRNIIGSIPSGKTEYVLATAEIGGTKQTARLDLCGYTVTSGLGNRSYLVKEGNTLVITDSKGGGVLYGGGYADNYGGTIGTESGSVVTLYGGTVTLRDDATAIPARGAVISVSGTLNVHGGTILVNKNVGSGVLIRDNKKMTMTGGHILNTASNDEEVMANVNLWTNAELRISGGIIENTGDNCRNLSSDGKIYMEDGTIKGGKLTIAKQNGGNININKNFMEMSGGSVIGGQCANQGGNFSVYGRLTVSGSAVIKDGKSADKSHYNITLIGGNSLLEAKGGTIAGGVGVNNGAESGKPNVKLSGKPVIDPAKTSTADLKPTTGLSIGSSSNLLDVTGLTGGTIYITATKAGQFAENATSGMENYFVSKTYEGDTLLPVCYANGGLYFGQVYCLCGFTKDGTTLKAHEYWCDGVDHIWLPFSQDHITTGGYYYLTGPVSRSYQTCIGEIDQTDKDPSLNFAVDVVLDLNGHNWTTTGRSFRLEMGSLGVTDTVGGATVTGGGTGDQSGVLLLSGNTTVNLYAGNWTLKSGKAAGSNGGIMDIGTNTVVNMYSGTISGGNANTTKGTGGGNISIGDKGTFNFYGGTISGGTSAKVGGNICVNGGQFNAIPSPKDVNGIAKREILGGTATDGGSIAVVAGAATIEKTTITGGTATNGGAISITGGTVTVDGSTVSGGVASYGGNVFVSGGTVTLNNSKLMNGHANNPTGYGQGGNLYTSGGTFTLDKDSTMSGGHTTNGNGSTWKPGANGFLAGGTTVIEGEVSGGYGASQGHNFYLEVGSTLNVDGGLVHNTTDGAHNIYIKGGELNVRNNGQIICEAKNSHNIYSNAEIFEDGETPTITIDSGLVSNEKTTGTSHNIYLSATATLNLNGGIVCNGQANQSTNVYLAGNATNKAGTITRHSVVNMTGGTITNSWTDGYTGRNVTLAANTEFNMIGGEISNARMKNSAGANILVNDGATFTLKGGTISGGIADYLDNEKDTGYGGSIRVEVGGTFNMISGKVTGGKLLKNTSGGGLGGNFFVGGTLNITGGTVEKGEAVTGGNIGTNNKNATIKISGVTIQDGIAKSGGNIYLNVRSCKEFTIGEGTKILNGQATAGSAGNIGINISQDTGSKPVTTMTIRGATITGGTATGEGGNVYIAGVSGDKASVRIENTTISGGTATTTGGLCASDGDVILGLDGKIVIDGNNGNNLWLANNATILVDDLTNGSRIGIAAASDRYVTDEVSAEEAAYFVADDPNKNTYFDADKVYLGQMHCICGKPDGTCTTYTDAGGNTVGCDGKEVKWTAWTGDTTLPTATGNYYLTKDVTVAANTALSANVVLDLNGYTVTVTGQRMYTPNSGATLTITNTVKDKGGIVVDGNVWGGGFVETAGTGETVNLYGVKLSMTDTSTASYSGGLLAVKNTSTLNIFGDTIIEGGNTAAGSNAGNIFVQTGATVNMFDGIVRDGKATYSDGGGEGGNFQCWGTLNMYGDSEISNKVYDYASSNIQLCGNSAVLNIYSGKITGDITYHQKPTVNLYPDAQITMGTKRGMPLTSSVVVNVKGELKHEIAVTLVVGTPPFAFAQGSGYTLDYASKYWFKPTGDQQVAFFEDGKLYIANGADHIHCECGGLLEGEEGHTCVDIIYQAMTKSNTSLYNKNSDLFAANYYLADDLVMNGGISIRHNADVKICLNGHTLSLPDGTNSRTISMFCDGTDKVYCTHNNVDTFLGTPKLALSDCDDGRDGKVLSTRAKADVGNVIWARYGEVTIYGATLEATGNTTETNIGLVLGATTGKITAYDMTLIGGVAGQNENSGYGSALAVDSKGTLILNGSLTVENGDVLDVYHKEGGIIDLTNLESVNETLRISAAGTFTRGYTQNTAADKASFFKAWDDEVELYVVNDELFAGRNRCYCGATDGNHTDGCIAASGVATAAEVKNIDWLPYRPLTSISAKGHFYLIHDVTDVNSKGVDSKETLALDLNGYDLNGKDGARVFSFLSRQNAELILTDTSSQKVEEQGHVISSGSIAQGPSIWFPFTYKEVQCKGNTVYLLGGTLDASGVTGRSSGGSVMVESASADNSFHMYGGKILGGTMTDYATSSLVGGAVYLAGTNNNFTLHDGTIVGGKAKQGGSVYVTGSTTFTMDGGSITGGVSYNMGGNIGIAGGTFILNDGEITNGHGENDNGGNVWISENGTMRMNGGKISGGMRSNSETNASANMYMVDTAKFYMTGGEITGYVEAYCNTDTGATIEISGNSKIHNGTNTKNLLIGRAEGKASTTIVFGELGKDAKIGLCAASSLAEGHVIASGVTAANINYIDLDETYWSYNISTGTGEVKLEAKP